MKEVTNSNDRGVECGKWVFALQRPRFHLAEIDFPSCKLAWLLHSNSHTQQTYLVLGSPVQSGLLSKFDKTGTETGPHRLKNLEKLD